MGLLPMDMDILPPSDDRIFKLLLTSPEGKPGLINLIAGILGRNVIGVEVSNNELPPGDVSEKAERFDVNCRIDDGSQINLEMQANRIAEVPDGEHRNLKGKSVYYLTDLHSSQPSKGISYDTLSSSYQITFGSYTVFANYPEYVNTFSLRHDVRGDLFSDAIRIIYVELSKLKELLSKPVEEMTTLDKWSLFLRYASDPKRRDVVNEVIASEEVLTVAGNILMGISQNERERAIFRSRKKFQTDYDSDMATSRFLGKQEGLEEGLEEGRHEGSREAQIQIARNALSMNMSVKDVVALTGLTCEEVERLQNTK